MNAVFGSLLENLAAIKLIFEPTVEPFKSDKGNTGDSREFTVGQFIERYLPTDYLVKKGQIYSRNSGESNNIDCVVLAPNHPRLITPKREIILAEGVYSAIEVKPEINVLTEKGEFVRGLRQIKSVKNLHRAVEKINLTKLFGGRELPPYFDKIPSILFSFKSADVSKTIQAIRDLVEKGELKADELPDMIVTMDHGVIIYTPHFSYNPIYNNLNELQKRLWGEEVFIHFQDTAQEMILAIFLSSFLNLTPPTMHTSRFMLLDYLSDHLSQLQIQIHPLRLNQKALLEAFLKNISPGGNQ